jgi:integrase
LEAEAWAAELERRIESGKPITGSGRTSLAAVMARYAAEVSPTKRGARWEIIRLEHIARDQIAEIDIERLTPEDIGQWRDRRLREVQAGTVLRDITLLTAVLEHARREWRLIETNPIRDVRKPQAPKARTRLPTDDEIERICIALGYDEESPVTTHQQQIAVAFLLAVETAMRAGELLSLTWGKVDLVRRVARLEKTKNGDSRDVPLSSRAVELFTTLRVVDPVRCFTVGARTRDVLFRRARDAAGIVGLTFHDSRALALTRLSSKFDVLQLARIAGHRDPKSLMAYYRESAEELARKLD